MLKTSLAGLGILILLPAAILSSACGDDDDDDENEVTRLRAKAATCPSWHWSQPRPQK